MVRPLLAFAALSTCLAAQTRFAGIQVQVAQPAGGLASDLNSHTGSGTGMFAGVRWDAWEVRGVLDYMGTQVRLVDTPILEKDGGRSRRDIWRNLALGADVTFRLESGDDPGLFIRAGGGVRNVWVNCTEGSLLEVTLLAALYALGGVSNASNYSVRSTELEAWKPYASLSLGWQASRSSALELKVVSGPYLRWKRQGLVSTGTGATEEAMAHQVSLAYSYRFDW